MFLSPLGERLGEGVEGSLLHHPNSRRLDRSAKRGAERPCFNDKQLIGDRRSLRAALRALVETTEIATCDSPAPHGGEELEAMYGDNLTLP
jgi:hypothetical protein